MAYAIGEAGVTELIGADEEVAATNYSASVGISLPTTASGRQGDGISGEILSVSVFAYHGGSGAVITPAGELVFFDADPSIAANDANLTASGVDHKLVIGVVPIFASDWYTQSDTGGGVAHKAVAVPFHTLSTIYASFKTATGTTTINSAGGDDEHVDFNFWFRIDR